MDFVAVMLIATGLEVETLNSKAMMKTVQTDS